MIRVSTTGRLAPPAVLAGVVFGVLAAMIMM
jgi:hypothetical protein